jgi:transposase-like protein
LKELLNWDLDIPCHNSIENWVKKSGLSIYKEPKNKNGDEDYALVVDESMMIGSQKMLLTLGVKAQHEGRPLSHGDVEVLGMSVRQSWNSEAVCSELEDVSRRLNGRPSYVISDNASVMNKSIRDFNVPHIRDISPTLGVFMERVYKKSEEFNNYMKELAQVKFREIMNHVAYLLPPKQRTVLPVL